MKVLLVKMSSLGDVVHMLPAISEASIHIPDLRIDWVVEEDFFDIPGWHPAVQRVIPIALRRWRKSIANRQTWSEAREFASRVRQNAYDLVLDTQGLLKSALVTALTPGIRVGHDFATAREGIASFFYSHRYHASWNQHAISRVRSLTAQALGYPMGSENAFRYGVVPPNLPPIALPDHFILALHGTARPEKEYPATDWRALIARINAMGLPVLLPWVSERERARAEWLAADHDAVILPKLGLNDLAAVLERAAGVVGVDTGLMHLAAAFRKPGVGLYPATPPERFGVRSELDAPQIVNLSAVADLIPQEAALRLQVVLANSQ